jgi:cephalosporin hydroxylase
VNVWDAAPVRRVLGDTGRERLRHRVSELRWAARLAVLPPRVAWFQIRARRRAWRTRDYLSLLSATRAADLRILLELAGDSRRVVELGTATGWTAISMALAAPGRHVSSYDIVQRPEPLRYLELVGPSVRERVRFITAPGSAGPAGGDRPGPAGPGEQSPAPAPYVDMLYIDSSHEREQTIAEVLAWRPVLRPGAPIVFDDYRHPDFPGVAEAIAELGLSGQARGSLFVHHTGR